MERRDRLVSAGFGVEYLEAALAAHGRRVVVADPGETTDDGETADDVVREMIEVLTFMCPHSTTGADQTGTAVSQETAA